MPAGMSSDFDLPLSGHQPHVFRSGRCSAFIIRAPRRLTDATSGLRSFQTRLENSLVDVISMSQRRDPLTGTRESSFTSIDVSWPGKYCQERAGEEPLPDWNVAHGVKKSGLNRWAR